MKNNLGKFEAAMAQVNDWIKEAEQDGDQALARGLKQAKQVLGGYSKLSEPTSAHNQQVMNQYNALVRMAMRSSGNKK